MTNAEKGEKEKRGRRGEGTIFWHEEKKCYRGDISLGYTPSGKRRRKTVYGPTVADVQDKFKKLRAEMENGVDSSAKYTVGEAVRDWLGRGLIGRDAGTIEKNRILAETHVIPLLGAVKLRELTADHVDDWLADRRRYLRHAASRTPTRFCVVQSSMRKGGTRCCGTSPSWLTYRKDDPADRVKQCRWLRLRRSLRRARRHAYTPILCCRSLPESAPRKRAHLHGIEFTWKARATCRRTSRCGDPSVEEAIRRRGKAGGLWPFPMRLCAFWSLIRNASTSSVTGRSGETCGRRMASFSVIATGSRSPLRA